MSSVKLSLLSLMVGNNFYRLFFWGGDIRHFIPAHQILPGCPVALTPMFQRDSGKWHMLFYLVRIIDSTGISERLSGSD